MASTTETPTSVGSSSTSASAPLLEDLIEEPESSSTSSTTNSANRASSSYGIQLVNAYNPTSSSSSNSYSSATSSAASSASRASTSYGIKHNPILSSSSNSHNSSQKRPVYTVDNSTNADDQSKDNLQSSSIAADGGVTNSGATSDGGDEEKKDDSVFECNICLDTAKDAVVSMCGHLFCWPCIHQWMNGYRNTCPVCKSSISKEKVIPLYGRGGSKEDPRKTVPPRPAGQRTEPEQPHGFQSFTGDGGFHMSFGIGAFPFGFFTSTLNFGDFRGANTPRENTRESEEDQFLSQVFVCVALIFLAWLAMA